MSRLVSATSIWAAGVAAVLGAAPASAHDPLPIGDGKVSSEPRAGYVFACQTSFRPGPGLQQGGDWIVGGQWYPSAKPQVPGAVQWPAAFTIEVAGDQRIIRGNSLPKHPTGTFPIPRSETAFKHDPNPNAIRAQTLSVTLPALPALAAAPSCVPMGPVGFALSGAYIYNALDAQGRDAPVHEMQDACNGHPEGNGRYHYHNWSPCLVDASGQAGRHSDLAGFARDGFGIFGPRGDGGRVLTNADLDRCHGHTHEVAWNGQLVAMYHYHFTAEYPYSIGCFRGVPVSPAAAVMGDAKQGPPGARQGAGAKKGAGGGAALPAAARELGVDVEALRRALGPPPPDFAQAAIALGIEEQRLRETMRRVRTGQ